MNEMVSTGFATLLDTLSPMHVVLNETGHIVHAGPTLPKILSKDDLAGLRFLELFELKRPVVEQTMKGLLSTAGVKLHIRLRNAPRTEMKGVLVPLLQTTGLGPGGGAVINLSFGISVVDAVQDFALTSADFAATDLAVEMLYLVEAKSAAMDASHKLNLRLQGAKIAAEEQAYTDTLTGLKNRRAMDAILQRLIDSETEFALVNLDLDYFKAVNDTLGHAAGDYVLQQAARIMVEETRGDDMIIRTGGDEFVLVFSEITDPAHVAEIADRLISRLERPMPFNDEICKISGSIGATLSCFYNSPDLDQMMRDSDNALYAAKRAGRGCHRLFQPAHSSG